MNTLLFFRDLSLIGSGSSSPTASMLLPIFPVDKERRRLQNEHRASLLRWAPPCCFHPGLLYNEELTTNLSFSSAKKSSFSHILVHYYVLKSPLLFTP